MIRLVTVTKRYNTTHDKTLEIAHQLLRTVNLRPLKTMYDVSI